MVFAQLSPQLTSMSSVFEPQMRARSNTWSVNSLPDNDETTFTSAEADSTETASSSPGAVETGTAYGPGTGPPGLARPRRTWTRRNAWGNQSYAEMIEQAISSSPEGRLTLAQIYEWIVENVEYFSDQRDSNSSAGWKVSDVFWIRS